MSPRPPAPGILRRNRAYRLAFLADLASGLGTGISAIAFPLLVLGIGGGAAQAGSVATVSLVTRLLFRLPAGHLVDRWRPRTVMVSTDLVRLVLIGSVPAAGALGALTYPHLLLVATGEGLATALFGPAAISLTRDVVAEEELADALGLGQAVQAVTALVGPATGGALYAADRMLPFVWDAASYLLSAVLLGLITAGAAGPARTENRTPREGDGITAGIRWLVGERTLFTIMLYGSIVNLACAAMDVMVVAVLRSHGESGTRTGLILSCAGVGAVAGALLSPRLVKSLSVRTILLGIGTVWTVVPAVFAAVYSPWLTGALLTVVMALSPAAGVAIGRALYSRTPRRLVGRVSAATSVLLTGLAALGPVTAGALFDAFGGPGGWWCMAGAIAVATAAGWVPLRAARGLKAPEPDAKDAADEEDTESGDDADRAGRPGPGPAAPPGNRRTGPSTA